MEKSNVDIQKFIFEGMDVRIVDQSGNPWFVAKDVAEVFGHTNHREAAKSLDDDEKDYVRITDAIGRDRETLIISESGLYHLVHRSNKPKAKLFARWVRVEVLPSIRKTGMYAKDNLSKAEMLLHSVQLMVEQERKIAQHEERITRIEERQVESQNTLDCLPEPSVEVPEKSTRSQVNQRVRSYVSANGLDFREVWNMIYTEYKYRYHVDVKLRAANRGMTPVEYLDSTDMMDELYAVVCELCR